MNTGVFIAALLAFAGFFGWFLMKVVRGGVIPGRLPIYRDKNPALFWLNICIVSTVVLAMGALAFFVLAQAAF